MQRQRSSTDSYPTGPVIFGTLYIFTLIGLLLKLISDITYVPVDPRIDFESREG